MHGDLIVWLDEEKKWNVDKEEWIGNSWGTKYIRMASYFETKEVADQWIKDHLATQKERSKHGNDQPGRAQD